MTPAAPSRSELQPMLPAHDSAAFRVAFKAAFAPGRDRIRALNLLTLMDANYSEWIGMSHDELVTMTQQQVEEYDERVGSGQIPRVFTQQYSNVIGGGIESIFTTVGNVFSYDMSAFMRAIYDGWADEYFTGVEFEDRGRSYDEVFLAGEKFNPVREDGLIDTLHQRLQDPKCDAYVRTFFPELPPASTPEVISVVKELFPDVSEPQRTMLRDLALSPEVKDGIRPDGSIKISREALDTATTRTTSALRTNAAALIPEIKRVGEAQVEASGLSRTLADRWEQTRREEELAKQRELAFKAAEAGLALLAALGKTVDPKVGRGIAVLGGAVVQVGRAVDALTRMGGMGAAIATGNIIGAISSVIGLFEPGKPAPEAIIRAEIKELREDVRDLQQAMETRLERIDRTLATMWRDVLTQFDAVRLDLSQVQADVNTIQRALIETMDMMRRFNADLMNGLRTLHDSPLRKTVDDVVDYRREVAVPLSYDRWKTHEETLRFWAKTECFNELQAGGESNGTPLEALEKLGPPPNPLPGRHIAYLSSWLAANKIPGFVAAGAKIANPAVWSTAARAYAALRCDWPEYSAMLLARRTDPVCEAGLTLHNSLTALAGGRTGSALWSGRASVFERYRHEVELLSEPVREAANTWWKSQGRTLADLWGSTSQPVTYQVPELVVQLSDGRKLASRLGPIALSDEVARLYVYLLPDDERSKCVHATADGVGWTTPTQRYAQPRPGWYARPYADLRTHVIVRPNFWPPNGASWIWYPEGNPASQAPADTRYFRRVVTVPADRALRGAEILVTADDQYVLYVNGAEAGSAGSTPDEWRQAAVIDIGRFLHPGPNTLAVAVTNAGGPASWIAKLRFRFDEASTTAVVTDSSWVTAREVQPRWQEPGFDDSTWDAAMQVAPYGAGPWQNHVHIPERDRISLLGVRMLGDAVFVGGFKASEDPPDRLPDIAPYLESTLHAGYERTSTLSDSDRATLGAEVHQLLEERRAAAMHAAADDVATGAAEPKARGVDGVKVVIQSLIELGFPAALATDDVVRLQVHGTAGIGGSLEIHDQLARLAPPVGNQPWRDLVEDFKERSHNLERLITSYLSAITQGKHTESHPLIEDTLTMLRIADLMAPPADRARKQWSAGVTAAGATAWQQDRSTGRIYVDIDARAEHFADTPFYFTSLSGQRGHLAAQGVHAIHRPTKDGFRVYLAGPTGKLTAEEANRRRWTVQWFAIERGRSRADATEPGATAWRQARGTGQIYLDVDTRRARFKGPPVYVAALAGRHGQLLTHGLHSIYRPTRTGCRIYLTDSTGELTPAVANERRWHVQWFGMERGRWTGATKSGDTPWRPDRVDGRIFVDVDTSAAHFRSTPLYFASLGGQSGHQAAHGVHAIHQPTETGFRVYITDSNDKLTPEAANQRRWHVQWLGVEMQPR